MTTTALKASVTFGKIILSAASVKLASFVVSAPFDREVAVNAAKSNPRERVWQESTSHPQIGGGWTTASMTYEEGTILLLQATRTRGGITFAEGGLFLRLRASAALISIMLELPQAPESLLGQRIAVFQGFADIVSPDELRALGIDVPRNYISRYLQADEIDELYTLNELRQQVTPPPSFVVVTTREGTKTKAVAAEQPRRIRLRR